MSKKITILFVETGYIGGGSFESLYQIIRNIDRDCFEPLVLYLNHTPYVGKMHDLNVKVFLARDFLYSSIVPPVVVRTAVRMGKVIGKFFPWLIPFYERIIHFKTIEHIRNIVKDKNVDLVVLNNTIRRHFFCIVGLNDIPVPIISYLRSFITNGMTRFVAEYGNNRVAQYVAYSDGVKDCWIRTGVDPSKVQVIHNGIEIADIEPLDVWKRMGVERRDGLLIGCVGAIKHNRGLDFLIRSFAHVLKEEPNAFLVIVGSQHYNELVKELKMMTLELGIANSVRFHGKDPEAKRMIAGMDVLSLPYRVEPFGRVLLEAWLTGTPVVASRVGNIDQIITHGKDGLLVEYGDENAMSQAIIELWQDKELRASVASEGRKTVEKRFSIGECTTKVEALCKSLV